MGGTEEGENEGVGTRKSNMNGSTPGLPPTLKVRVVVELYGRQSRALAVRQAAQIDRREHVVVEREVYQPGHELEREVALELVVAQGERGQRVEPVERAWHDLGEQVLAQVCAGELGQ